MIGVMMSSKEHEDKIRQAIDAMEHRPNRIDVIMTALEGNPDLMSNAELREDLRSRGLDPDSLVRDVKAMVEKSLKERKAQT